MDWILVVLIGSAVICTVFLLLLCSKQEKLPTVQDIKRPNRRNRKLSTGSNKVDGDIQDIQLISVVTPNIPRCMPLSTLDRIVAEKGHSMTRNSLGGWTAQNSTRGILADTLRPLHQIKEENDKKRSVYSTSQDSCHPGDKVTSEGKTASSMCQYLPYTCNSDQISQHSGDNNMLNVWSSETDDNKLEHAAAPQNDSLLDGISGRNLSVGSFYRDMNEMYNKRRDEINIAGSEFRWFESNNGEEYKALDDNNETLDRTQSGDVFVEKHDSAYDTWKKSILSKNEEERHCSKLDVMISGNDSAREKTESSLSLSRIEDPERCLFLEKEAGDIDNGQSDVEKENLCVNVINDCETIVTDADVQKYTHKARNNEYCETENTILFEFGDKTQDTSCQKSTKEDIDGDKSGCVHEKTGSSIILEKDKLVSNKFLVYQAPAAEWTQGIKLRPVRTEVSADSEKDEDQANERDSVWVCEDSIKPTSELRSMFEKKAASDSSQVCRLNPSSRSLSHRPTQAMVPRPRMYSDKESSKVKNN